MPVLLLLALIGLIWLIAKAFKGSPTAKGISFAADMMTDPRVGTAAGTFAALRKQYKAGLIGGDEVLRLMWAQFPDVMAKYPELSNDILKAEFGQK